MEYLDKNGLEKVWSKILDIIEETETKIPSEDDINALIDAKIGEIENGTY